MIHGSELNATVFDHSNASTTPQNAMSAGMLDRFDIWSRETLDGSREGASPERPKLGHAGWHRAG